MHPAGFAPFPDIDTERLHLRQITDNDLDEFFLLKSDERLLKHYDARARNYEQSRQKLHALNEEIAKKESITWGIALKNEGRLIGSICFWNISEERSQAEIGYELMVDWQGKGIMQEAVKAVIGYGFSRMNLRRIEAVPNPNHLRSIHLLEKNGFTKVEEFTEKDPYDGKILQRVSSYFVQV